MQTGAEIIVEILKKQGTTVVFGYPGATNAPLYEALSQSGIRHILTRGEQAAAHAASGYARVGGRPGVCLATSGPGATNLITGIATAYMDSVPLVAITGQVPTEKIGQDVFQEADITGATAPFCKHNYLVKEVGQLARVMKEAFYIASTGRPGPVVVDVPVDVQLAQEAYDGNTIVDIKGYKPTYVGNGGQIKKAAAAIAVCERPVILAGGGVLRSSAQEALVMLAEKINAPVVTTLMGITSIPTKHPLHFGMVGSHGFPLANQTLRQADLLILAGARAADRAVSFASKELQKNVIHIDIDPAEIGKILATPIPIVGDVKQVITQLIDKTKPRQDTGWLPLLQGRRRKEAPESANQAFVNPEYALSLLSRLCPADAIVSTEVGQNQIWTARCWEFQRGTSFLTSGGLGTMGYGLPAAVGAKITAQNRMVVAVEGDGSFQMSLPELATIAANHLDIKILLLKNGRLGMVNELQRQKGYHQFSVTLDGSPDFCKLAAAYGISSESVSGNSGLEAAYGRMLRAKEAYLLELVVEPDQPTIGG